MAPFEIRLIDRLQTNPANVRCNGWPFRGSLDYSRPIRLLALGESRKLLIGQRRRYCFHRHVRAEVDDSLAPFDRLLGGGEIDSIDAEVAGGDSLFSADAVWVDAYHLGGHAEIVVQALGRLLDALFFKPLRDSGEVIILRNVMQPSAIGDLVQLCGNILQALLIAAAVADQNDVLEAVTAKRAADVRQ